MSGSIRDADGRKGIWEVGGERQFFVQVQPGGCRDWFWGNESTGSKGCDSPLEYRVDGLWQRGLYGSLSWWDNIWTWIQAAEAVRQLRQLGKDKLNSILRLVVKLYQCGSREKIILLLIIKVFIIMSNNLQKENLEIEKNIITVDELSDEYIDKKSKLKKLIAR